MSHTPTEPIDFCEVNQTNHNCNASATDLHARINRLQTMLIYARRVYADLVAACRATLTAHADGEPDPLAYIRDELPAAPPEHPLSRESGGGR